MSYSYESGGVIAHPESCDRVFQTLYYPSDDFCKRSNGIERTQVAELFGQTLFACPIYQNYGRAIAQEQYEPAGFKLSLGLKDVDLVLQTAQESQMPMPLASLVHDRLIAAVAKGRGEIDWTGLALGVSEDAGLK